MVITSGTTPSESEPFTFSVAPFVASGKSRLVFNYLNNVNLMGIDQESKVDFEGYALQRYLLYGTEVWD